METIKSYKGFDKDLKCRGFQFEIGKEYEEKNIEICSRGFHACESPLEVFLHYNMLDSRFCEVEQSGEIQREENTTKICSSKIIIKAELTLKDMINLGVKWLEEATSSHKIKSDIIGLNDNGSNFAQIGSSGDSAQIGSSGYSAWIGSSGDFARIGSSGDSAQIGSFGKDSVIMCAGQSSKVRACIGSWITLTEWRYSSEKKRWIPVCVKTEYVDGERIKSDTWYMLKDGEFTEVEP